MPTGINLSEFAGVGDQLFDNNGNPLSGGKIYTYDAGTTTPVPSYTTFEGDVEHTNPIILDSTGRVPGGQIWMALDIYKFVVTTSTDVLIGTYDNIGPPDLVGLYAPLASPALTDNPTAPTPAQFDDDTSIATTAFVQRASGNLSGVLTPTTSTTLTAAEIGRLIVFYGSTAGQTLTLPAVASIPFGNGYWFQNISTVSVTIKGNAAEIINANAIGTGQSAANTLILGTGDSCFIGSLTTAWYEQQGVRAATLSSLGCSNQDLVDVSASRTYGVAYQNTTGRSIWVFAGGTATGAQGYYVLYSTQDANPKVLDEVLVDANGIFSISGIVKAGEYYIMGKGGADTLTSIRWIELR